MTQDLLETKQGLLQRKQDLRQGKITDHEKKSETKNQGNLSISDQETNEDLTVTTIDQKEVKDIKTKVEKIMTKLLGLEKTALDRLEKEITKTKSSIRK